MNHYLAIDIGASSGRHIVSSIVNGKIVLEEIYRFPNLPDEVDGHLVWNTKRLFREILTGLKKAKELGKQVDYIGIDTWAVDYVLLNDKDERFSPAFCYRDKRGMEASEKVHSLIPFEELYKKTGMQFQPFNTIYQLYDDVLSLRMNRAESMLMLPDYFNFLLTGIKKQEYTNAVSTGMVNVKTHQFDEEIISKLGFKRSLFTPLTQPGSIVGHLSEKIQREVGYDAVVLLPATHDTASAVLAAPIESQTPYISSGTWSLLGIEQNIPHTDKESMKFNYSNEGSLDYQFRYQKNIMGLWIIQSVRHELNDQYSFAQLADMAREGKNDLVFDANDASFLAPKSMIEAIEKKIGKVSLPQLAYSIFHSLALSYRDSLLQLEKLNQTTYPTLNIIGGGCQNKLLNELTKEVTGKKIIIGPVEATALGNLLMQMMATGEIDSLSSGRKLIRSSFNDIQEV